MGRETGFNSFNHLNTKIILCYIFTNIFVGVADLQVLAKAEQLQCG